MRLAGYIRFTSQYRLFKSFLPKAKFSKPVSYSLFCRTRMLPAMKGAYKGFTSVSFPGIPDRPINHRVHERRAFHSNLHLLGAGSTPFVESSRFRNNPKKLMIPQSTAAGELCTSSVKFSVPVRVDFGETVKVVGNHPALGSWQAENGLELQWTDGHIWEQETSITPGEYEFKCVIVCSQGCSRWEPGPNRVLKIEEGQRFLDVGCEWWHTSMNNIKAVNSPLTFEQQEQKAEELSSSLLAESAGAGRGVLELVAAGHCIPHVEKVEKKGEDAYFISSARNGVIGLADGVGSWVREGIDPALYAKGLMKETKRAVGLKKKKFSAKECMMIAQNKTAVIGSSTCVLAILENNILDVANLGDSGLKILRDGKIILSTKPQEHEFNFPYQLACLDYTEGDKALDADEYKVEVQDGDILVMGSDGIFDNLWDEGLIETVEATLLGGLDQTEYTAMALANAISLVAHQNAQNSEFYSPWTDGATRAAGQTAMVDHLVFQKTHNPYMGGKMDDCTTVVAFIKAQTS